MIATLPIERSNFVEKIVHFWIDGEFDRITVCYGNFSKNYLLKLQQNLNINYDFVKLTLSLTYK
jgi:hypothetical protein